MKIAVISDTHIGDHLTRPPEALWDLVAGANAVAHLGDFTDEAFAHKLKSRKTLYAVSGNCDPYPIRKMFPAVRVVTLAGVRIAMMHQFAGPWEVAEARASNYHRLGVSVILFGHTHKAEDIEIGGVRLINPGSAGDGRRTKGRLSAGMLEISEGTLSWEQWPLGLEVAVS